MSTLGNMRTFVRSARAPLFFAGGMASAQLVSAIFFVVAARYLGPVRFGELAACYATATFLAVGLDLGESSHAVRDIAAGGGDIASFHVRFAGSRGGFLLLVASVGGLLSIRFGFVGFAIILSSLMAAQNFFVAPLRVKADAVRLSVCYILEKLISLLLLAFFTTRYEVGPLDAVIALCGGLVFSLVFCFHFWPWRDVISCLRLSREAWAGGRHMGSVSILSRAMALDVVLLTAVGSKATAGSFAAISRWGSPFTLYAQSMAQFSFPSMAAAKSGREALLYLRNVQMLLIPASLLLVGMAMASPIMVDLLLGAAFSDSWPALSILCIGVLASMYSTSYYVFIQARHLERYSTRVYGRAVALQLVLLLPVSHVWGAAGASLCFSLGQIALLMGTRKIVCRDLLKEMHNG